jgi:hypothetical protein
MSSASSSDEQNGESITAYATALADAIDGALAGWVERSVRTRLEDWQGYVPDDMAAAARQAGQQARDEAGPQVRHLLATDVDQQSTTPLALLRRAVRFPTAVLERANVPPVVRDEFAERAFPEDRYDLAPATFADVDPALAEPGLAWGAAKAHVVLTRRRAEGRR